MEGNRRTAVDAFRRLVYTDGEIEIRPDDRPPLRVRTEGGWRTVETDGERVYGPISTKTRAGLQKLTDTVVGVASTRSSKPNYVRAIEHAIGSLGDGTEPIIAGERTPWD
ncbi:hypothetical protein [Halalkaliarchaeum sp. AArc-CO]|uniref:hypothetical protein n=1 Tax=Halalkaliarchaeum sp. AArc-CO TaxID=2866381 RepID=UPI00217CDCAF|nr:hypothetical protein [Halalkaliarchaeum sp. AArc-CO]